MAEELEQNEHKLMNLTSDLIQRIEFQKMKSFFYNINPEEGLDHMNENAITGKDFIIKNIEAQIKILNEIKQLDLQEETVTAKVKTTLVETIDKAISLIKEEL